MESYSIIQNARKELINLIRENVIPLYKKLGLPKPEEGKPYIIEVENLLRPFSIDVEVDNSCLDGDTRYERQAVSCIMADAEGNCTIYTENDKFSMENLSLEALYAISDALEMTYKLCPEQKTNADDIAALAELRKKLSCNNGIERIAIIDNAMHTLYIEDIPLEVLEEKYNGNEEDYIKDNYTFMGDWSWDYVSDVEYTPNGGETLSIEPSDFVD